MITSLSAPMFAGRKRQQPLQDGTNAQRRRLEPDMFDSITVDVPSGDIYAPSTRATTPSSQLNAEQEMASLDYYEARKATIPALGDTSKSRTGGNLRHQARLLSEKELRRDLEQHSSFKTHAAMELILDVDHPLEPDAKSKNPAHDRYLALRDLRAKVDDPSYRLSPSSKRYLKSVGLINSDNVIEKATCYDVAKLLTISPKGKKITLELPKRSEARTYWLRPRTDNA